MRTAAPCGDRAYFQFGDLIFELHGLLLAPPLRARLVLNLSGRDALRIECIVFVRRTFRRSQVFQFARERFGVAD